MSLIGVIETVLSGRLKAWVLQSFTQNITGFIDKARVVYIRKWKWGGPVE